MDSIEKQFEGIKVAFAKRAYEEIAQINRFTENRVAQIRHNSRVQLKKIRENLSCEYLKTIEHKYNKEIADNILEINKAILEMKNFFFTDFFQSLEFAYSEIIGDNFDGYKRLIMNRIGSYLLKFDSNVKIRANMRDSEFIRDELFEITKLRSFPHKIQVLSEPIETVGGFIMYDKDEKFFIDWRYETIIELKKQEIAKIIEEKFPFYIDKRDSALNIMEKCHI